MHKTFRILLRVLGFVATVLVFYTALFFGLQISPAAANVFLGVALVMLIATIATLAPSLPQEVKALCGVVVFGLFLYVASVLTSTVIMEHRSLVNAWGVHEERLSPAQWRQLERYHGNDPALAERRRRAEEELDALDRAIRQSQDP